MEKQQQIKNHRGSGGNFIDDVGVMCLRKGKEGSLYK